MQYKNRFIPILKSRGFPNLVLVTGGGNVPATVFPFILRGVNLLGIDSVYCPMEVRKLLWKRMATDFKPDVLDSIYKEISLEELVQTLPILLQGEARGRFIVKI
jgi:acrylyl-CoA reductase (NADPH)